MSAHEFATLTTDDLVTGEAVALDLPPAGLGTRMVSGLIDVPSRWCCSSRWSCSSDREPADRRRPGVGGLVGTLITVFLVFPTTMETLTHGKSLGKLAMGLRAVRDDAGPVSFQQSFVRALIAVVEVYAFTGVPAFFCALLNSRGKRLGDLAAGTYVVRERVRLRLAPPTADAAAARRLGEVGRHRLAPGRAGAGRAPVPRPATHDRPGVAGEDRRPPRRAGLRRTSSPPRRPAPRRRTSSAPSSRPVASATRPGWPGRPRCGHA